MKIYKIVKLFFPIKYFLEIEAERNDAAGYCSKLK